MGLHGNYDMQIQKWQFASRFKRNAFGWRSDAPIQRIKEALSEIKKAARVDGVLAGEGAVLFLERVSPALQQVDGSSGAIGSAVNRAIDALVGVIVTADVADYVRHKWLERLWAAVEDDEIPYIEALGEYWGELCKTRELASIWADEFLPTVLSVWTHAEGKSGYFNGTTACLSSLLAAQRYDELLSVLERAPFRWWHSHRWGVKALSAMGRPAEALAYAEASRGRNDSPISIAATCESILLASGQWEEAYSRYGIVATTGTTYLARFRTLVKKYPLKAPHEILQDLAMSEPGNEGKWFAAAKDAGLYDEALQLAARSATDPRTLTRAARDFGIKRPEFALQCGLMAMHWISLGFGYELTSEDVRSAYEAAVDAAAAAQIPLDQVQTRTRSILAMGGPQSAFIAAALEAELAVST